MIDLSWLIVLCVLMFLILNVIVSFLMLVRELKKDDCPYDCMNTCPQRWTVKDSK